LSLIAGGYIFATRKSNQSRIVLSGTKTLSTSAAEAGAGAARHRLTYVQHAASPSPKHFPNLDRLGDRGKVRGLGWRNRIDEVTRRVGLAVPFLDGEAKYATNLTANAVSCKASTTTVNAFQDTQNLGRVDFSDRAST
jgi:hypothetical protein